MNNFVNRFWPPYRFKWAAIFVSFFVLLLLTACDPCLQLGVQEVRVPPDSKDPGSSLIAKVPMWGVCSGAYYYESKDGGIIWNKLNIDPYVELALAKPVSGDCDEYCEFPDTYNTNVKYRIIAGKSLQRLNDQGAEWQEIVKIPNWNQMAKNYVNYMFENEDFKDIENRGPYHAVTDPKTGNVLLAMGVEGVLIVSPERQLTWSSVDRYREVKPTAKEMLALVDFQEWARSLLITLVLMTIGFRPVGANRFRIASLLIIILAFWLILIPLKFTADRIVIFFMYNAPRLPVKRYVEPGIIFLAAILLLTMIAINLKTAFSRDRKKVLVTMVLSILAGLIYALAFFAWSQGWTPLISGYNYATLTGMGTFFILLLVVSIYKRNHAVRTISNIPSDDSPRYPIS